MTYLERFYSVVVWRSYLLRFWHHSRPFIIPNDLLTWHECSRRCHFVSDVFVFVEMKLVQILKTIHEYQPFLNFNSLKHWYRNHYFLRVLSTKWGNLSCLDLGTAAFKAIHPREAEQFCKEARLQKFWLQSKSLSRAAARARNFRSSSSSNSKLPLREKDIYERYWNTWRNVIFIFVLMHSAIQS